MIIQTQRKSWFLESFRLLMTEAIQKKDSKDTKQPYHQQLIVVLFKRALKGQKIL